ncbi:hypothetical protein [Streptomyces sp. S.PB5]|uniref:hypothetical protein n=1 Tax=Streptomyces sp. S.PB5 TaxID=3020844 RepID=UPI0025B25ECD|nr:hypothetical protein [Streptomyces sp. S.PB5]MDN3026396.1 hypothetical protein [Streptomyces sp. S.PB5]
MILAEQPRGGRPRTGVILDRPAQLPLGFKELPCRAEDLGSPSRILVQIVRIQDGFDVRKQVPPSGPPLDIHAWVVREPAVQQLHGPSTRGQNARLITMRIVRGRRAGHHLHQAVDTDSRTIERDHVVVGQQPEELCEVERVLGERCEESAWNARRGVPRGDPQDLHGPGVPLLECIQGDAPDPSHRPRGIRTSRRRVRGALGMPAQHVPVLGDRDPGLPDEGSRLFQGEG